MRAGLAVIVGLLGCGRSNFQVDADVDGSADAAPAGSGNVAFVTSTQHLPTMFSADLAGPDMICNARAAAAGLTGTYVAFLSSSTVTAHARLTGSRGWVRPNGTPFADTVEDVFSGHILNPLALDEFGDSVGGSEVATATTSLGVAGPNCTDFTDSAGTIRVGQTLVTTGFWASIGDDPCTIALRLYCFGVGRAVPLVYTPATGRRAFVTLQTFTPGGGLAAADALCANEAAFAGFTGTFKALLATTTASAISRFSTTGPTWVRVDGIPIADTAVAFASENWRTTLNVTVSPTYVTDSAFGGATSLIATGTVASTCNDWIDSGGQSVAGYSYYVGDYAFAAGTTDCSARKIYCLEQ